MLLLFSLFNYFRDNIISTIKASKYLSVIKQNRPAALKHRRTGACRLLIYCLFCLTNSGAFKVSVLSFVGTFILPVDFDCPRLY